MKKEQIPIAEDIFLRKATPADAEPVFRLIDEGRSYLREWLPFIDLSQSTSDTEQYLQSVSSPENESDEVFCIIYLEEVVGLIGLKVIDYINQKLEIGYWLGERFQGKGIMRRSCIALVNHIFSDMNMNRIQINVGVGNDRSNNIPKKLGFLLEGVQREGEFLNETFHDLEVYSLLKKEWKERGSSRI
ncbi:GNAT family N-acetyltransferase [Pontibacter silvestris]|uniref:GNAT family N-acetyltransferase n=1 Tax=Pontibacter silvestris TaxID=2305183 RepID=A0ABW4X1A5_9BACT|nr:GNAT family protein [Pontibacter silvestris]MCC9135493.1 GNAT family N-acetyltransferase [Pontibacter silvestris]